MTYEYLQNLKENHTALHLLNADNFAMIVGFFDYAFKSSQAQAIKESAMMTLLDDYLYGLNQRFETPKFPKSAKAYLDDFTHQNSGYLRKYYGYESDEPLYELTPESEKLLMWVESLQKQEFVATESKLKIIMTLLKELAFETQLSDEERISTLEAEKRAIDRKIEAIKNRQDLRFDERKIKEQFMQIERNSSELLSDFREIEYNFRSLNQEAKEAIANSQGGKGAVLQSIFEMEDKIRHSHQGQSFYAFWDFLMDRQQIEHLDGLVENLYTLLPIQAMDSERKLENLKFHLLSGGEKSHKVLAKLIEQLRRFIDDKVWVEHRRILELANHIEQKAIQLKENPPTQREFFTIDGVKITVESIASKSLFAPKEEEAFTHALNEEIIDVDLTKLYTQIYIDEQQLKSHIHKLLQQKPQFTLKELNDTFPIQKGVAEVVVYLKLAQSMENAYLEEAVRDEIIITDEAGARKRIRMDRVVFVRK